MVGLKFFQCLAHFKQLFSVLGRGPPLEVFKLRHLVRMRAKSSLYRESKELIEIFADQLIRSIPLEIYKPIHLGRQPQPQFDVKFVSVVNSAGKSMPPVERR